MTTAPPPAARVVVTGGVAAYDIRDFLTRAAVPFTYLDDEGPAEVAVCTFDDGRCLTNPTIQDVGRALGLVTPPSRDSYDFAVIGAGPAGLAAAVYASCDGLSTWWSRSGPPAARPAPAGGSRTTSASPRASAGRNWPSGPATRPRSSGPRSSCSSH